MNATHRSSAIVGGIVVGSLVLTLSACGSDDDGQAAAPAATEAGAPDIAPTVTTTPAAATATTTNPATTTATATSTAPPETTEPKVSVPADPVPVRDFMFLTPGWTYTSKNFSVPITFTIPSDGVAGRWRLLFDSGNYVVLTRSLEDKAEPNIEREEPGVVIYAVPQDVTVDDFVEAWTAYGTEQQSFTAEVTDGAYLGSPATVIRGTYDIESPLNSASVARLGDSIRMPVAPGERTYVSYLVAVGDRTVMVRTTGHEIDFDLAVTMVNQVVDTLEFAEAGT